ncbi:hypothetical protein ACFFF5_06575 [Lederbergia wuyishanensis]|uniref:DUF3888 domain-containing protein n=1 Tax=Lederbergia wuyishanensis TaxID=1347903 RepID=A0ABU0D2T4_9BACI|nr:hypothetical protein [Lederbergia wuyishanensis]MCJ8007155.1 hypothetical protein [Lederbergia wuyishanensis]MDQ0342700.1 hypothetical protein [Lederbergia wuyishanensis]
MRKILTPILLLLFIFPTVSLGAKLYGSECPNTEILLKTNEKDKDELVKALNEIIPKVYGSSPDYKEWRIEVIKPMPRLTGFEENYYKMAINFCGKRVADHSWFVRLRFPRLLPAQSASLGELYIVKEKNNKWFSWFQYH